MFSFSPVSKSCAIPDHIDPGAPVKNILSGSFIVRPILLFIIVLNTYMKNQTDLNNYFGEHWQSKGFPNYELSGFALISKIQPNEHVLDVGCGYNPFKGKIPNLVGIDPANDAADYKISIEDFEPDYLFDVAFCLGSINFGTYDDIVAGINNVVKCLHDDARIYWRCNPGRYDHASDEFKKIPVYPWTFEDHESLARKFGFRLVDIRWDSLNRIYAEWQR